MSAAVRIGRIGGVPVSVDLWWGLITAVIGVAMYVRASAGADAVLVPVVVAAIGSLLVLGSVVVHEMTHAVVARRLGIGVVSVSLFVFGGYSELEGEPTSPRDELLVAGSGPLASLILAGLLALAGLAVRDGIVGGGEVLALLAVVNLAVAVFNLLPGMPLDGGRVLRSLVWRMTSDPDRATRIASWAGVAIGVAVSLSGIIGVVAFGTWIWLWNTAVGVFLVRVALESVRSTEQVAAGAVVDRDVPVVMRAESAGAAALRLAGRGADRPVAVVGRGRVVGIVDRAALEASPASSVGDVMQLLEPDDIVDANEPIGEVMRRLRGSARAVVVVRKGRTVGVLAASDFDDILRRTG